MAREPGEFCMSVEQEESIIQNKCNDEDSAWFVAEYEGKLVGQCSVGLVRSNLRYRHRAQVAFVILRDYQRLARQKRCLRIGSRNDGNDALRVLNRRLSDCDSFAVFEGIGHGGLLSWGRVWGASNLDICF